MRCCHRANTSLKCHSEINNRSAPLLGVRDDSSDSCECVFDAMVELGIQDFSGLLGSLALCDVDVHADHASCVACLVILYETACLDPADRSAGTHNAKLCVMLAAPLGTQMFAVLQKLRQVVWM